MSGHQSARQQRANVRKRKQRARSAAAAEHGSYQRRAEHDRLRQEAKGRPGFIEQIYGSAPSPVYAGLSLGQMAAIIATPAERERDRIEAEGGDLHEINARIIEERGMLRGHYRATD